MSGSGKQILLSILSELSTQLIAEEDLPRATRRLRAGLLAHGSTADDSYEWSSRVHWRSEHDSEGDLCVRAMAVGDGKLSITELYDTVFEMQGLKEHVLAKHPNLDGEDFAAFQWILWLLVSSVRMVPVLLDSERGQPTVDEWVEVASRHYDNHFASKKHG